jgi:hypothetical protein
MCGRNVFRMIACVMIIVMLMGLVGCEANGLGMSFAESIIAAALVGSPLLLVAKESVRRWRLPRVQENSTDAEIMTVMDAYRDKERESDLQQWFTDGGRVGPWD